MIADQIAPGHFPELGLNGAPFLYFLSTYFRAVEWERVSALHTFKSSIQVVVLPQLASYRRTARTPLTNSISNHAQHAASG